MPDKTTILLGAPLSGKTTRICDAYAAAVQDGFTPNQILCLSFFAPNAEAIRRALRSRVAERLPWVTTVQRFLTLLLRDHATDAHVPARAAEITPGARSLVIRQAWAEGNGSLWREFGKTPGALRELTRILDWLSQNRTRFAIGDGELGTDELAQTYRRYIELCAQRQWLTFQEASLRVLDLLAEPRRAKEFQARFPIVLVDDLHQARPDQVAVIAALRAGAREFVATAWLGPEQSAPELQHVWQAIQTWGIIESLPAPVRGINPAVSVLAARALAQPFTLDLNGAGPVVLRTPLSVEDEMHAAAQVIGQAQQADPSLQPGDIVVVAADPNLVPFAQRVLAGYGLPVPPLEPRPAHTPLLRGALLVLRRQMAGATLAIERELLSLPYVPLEAPELAALYRAAAGREKTILALSEDERPMLSDEGEATLARLRAALALVDPARPADSIARAMDKLGALSWLAQTDLYAGKQRERQVKAYTDWLQLAGELEATAAALGPAPDDLLALLEGVANEVGQNDDEAETGIRIVDANHTNGVGGRLALVVGLSESAAPVRHPLMQLRAEAELSALFADGRAVVLPAARDQAAWIERESRRLAQMLTRGRERLHVSVSHYAAGGDAQLPSPFFERLLGGDGEIDREGGLRIKQSNVWAQPELTIEAPALPPSLPPTPADGVLLLDNHRFSSSQIRMYLTCPLQFFYARVLGIDMDEPGVFDRGSLLHELLCATMGDGTLRMVDLRARKRPAWLGDAKRLRGRALAALAAAWSGEPVTLTGGGTYEPTAEWRLRFGPELQQRAVRQWAEKVLSNWSAYESEVLGADDSRRPVLLEMPFAMQVGPYQVSGRIDRIDEVRTQSGVVYELIDYKTGNSSADSITMQMKKFLPLDGEAAKDYQLPLYALALAQGIGGLQAQPARLGYYNLEKLERGKRGAFGAAARRVFDIVPGGEPDAKTGRVPLPVLNGAISRSIIATMDAMSRSPYKATPDFHCGWCSFRAACDRGKAEVREAA